MPLENPEKVRKILAELKSGDREERILRQELLEWALRYAGSQGAPVSPNDLKWVEYIQSKLPHLKVDLSKDKVSTVDQKIVSNLMATAQRDQPQLQTIFRESWEDTEAWATDKTSDESRVAKLVTRLRYYVSNKPVRLKAEVQRAISDLEDTEPASQALQLYRVNYLDIADSTQPTRGRDFVNPESTIPRMENQRDSGQLQPYEERRQIEPPSPYVGGEQTNPRDKPGFLMTEREALEDSIRRGLSNLDIADLKTLNLSVRTRLGERR